MKNVADLPYQDLFVKPSNENKQFLNNEEVETVTGFL